MLTYFEVEHQNKIMVIQHEHFYDPSFKAAFFFFFFFLMCQNVFIYLFIYLSHSVAFFSPFRSVRHVTHHYINQLIYRLNKK